MSTRQPKNFYAAAGISLLEVLLSLSIIAIILVMATRYFFVASQNDKINTTVSQVGGLVAAAHNWKGANPNYTGIAVDTLIHAGQLTNFPGIDLNTNTISTMWATAIDIKPADNMATIDVILPDAKPCEAIQRAFPGDASANITSACSGSTFTYTFP